MNNLPNELLVIIFLFLSPEDKLKCKLVSKIFNYLIDDIPFCYQFTLKIERIRAILARKIRNMMISDVDISNKIYKNLFQYYILMPGYTENENGEWNKIEYIVNTSTNNIKRRVYWTLPNRPLTWEEQFIKFYDSHKTTCLLVSDWIITKLNEKFNEVNENNDDNLVKMCTFWGINYQWCKLSLQLNESPFELSPDPKSKYYNKISSSLPTWAKNELFPNL